jgi:hypothetical protein
MDKIDRYNNIPPGSGSSKCGAGARPTAEQQYNPQLAQMQAMQLQQQQAGAQYQQYQAPQFQQAPQGGQFDPQTEIFMLRSDLKEAIAYIQRLGGSWPPPPAGQMPQRPTRR